MHQSVYFLSIMLLTGAIEQQRLDDEEVSLVHNLITAGHTVNLTSSLGRFLFKQAITGSYATSFYKLISNYRTQEGPTYCGLTTLTMALTTLNVDNEYYAKPWEFKEEQLACCPDLSVIKRRGITFAQLTCLASIHGLDVIRATHANNSDEGLNAFRATVIDATASEHKVLAVNYNRRLLSFRSGHVSPIAAYHAATDRALVLEVQRYWFEPQWIELSALYRAIVDVDQTSGESRGYAIFTKSIHRRPTLLTQLLNTFESRAGSQDEIIVRTVVLNWRRWVSRFKSTNDSLSMAVGKFGELMADLPFCCRETDFCEKRLFGEQQQQSCVRESKVSTSQFCAQLVRLPAFESMVAEPRHLLANLFIVWPFSKDLSNRERWLAEHVDAMIAKSADAMQLTKVVEEGRHLLREIIARKYA